MPRLIGPLASYRPHPPICNRTGSDWGEPPLICHCDEWPTWIAGAPSVMDFTNETVTCLDGSFIIRAPAGQQTNCPNWRPGINHGRERYYYNRDVHCMYKISTPTTTEIVIAVN